MLSWIRDKFIEVGEKLAKLCPLSKLIGELISIAAILTWILIWKAWLYRQVIRGMYFESMTLKLKI